MNMMTCKNGLLLWACILSSNAIPAMAQVKDTIELKTIKIKGNKELPKILYLVPWQESKGKMPVGKS